MILQQLDMVERAFDQRLVAGFAIFFEQILFEAARVDPDADRASVRLCRAPDLADALGRSAIAGVHAQACGAGAGRCEVAPVVEMDVDGERKSLKRGLLGKCESA